MQTIWQAVEKAQPEEEQTLATGPASGGEGTMQLVLHSLVLLENR